MTSQGVRNWRNKSTSVRGDKINLILTIALIEDKSSTKEEKNVLIMNSINNQKHHENLKMLPEYPTMR